MSEEQIQNSAENTAEFIETPAAPVETPTASAKEEMKEKTQEVISKAKEKAKEMKTWFGPVTAALAGGILVAVVLIATNHLVWDGGPRLISVNDAYVMGVKRGIRDIEAMPWYSRVWSHNLRRRRRSL